ncbi:hypothetical protein ACKKBF_B12695 [Auxenochlorella protothecoides x Auxenochlorella symbiontica]
MTGNRSLYEVLGLDSTATQAAIRKSYLKLAVLLHPDKNPGDETANERFQTLARVYAVLGDEERRKLYDETGVADDLENPSAGSFEDLFEFYRSMYKEVTEQDLDDFEAKYRGSEEEKADVLKYYDQFSGDMDKVLAWVMCSDPGHDAHRFADIIADGLRASGEAPSKKFAAWEKKMRRRKAPDLATSVAKGGGSKKEKTKGNTSDLVALIRSRRSGGPSFIDALASKYGVNPSGDPEPSEEEFAAAAARHRDRAAGQGFRGAAKKRQKAG